MRGGAGLSLVLLALACGPLGPLPGGQLSGEVANGAPRDWSFSEAYEVVQLETRPQDPYSVNLWGTAVGDRFYLGSGRGGDSAWVEHIAADAQVRLRVGDKIYELRAVRVEDPEERQRFVDAMKRKYEWEPTPDQRAEAWLYRLDPR